MTEFAVRDLLPNPFRHMDRYPIRRDKVEALKESLRSTGFWDNVVAREQNGRAEIAYGHHRLVALKEEFGPDHTVNVILRDLDDTAMLQIMARENMEEWGSNFFVELETVETTLQAFAEGIIDLRETDAPERYIKTVSGPPGAGTRRYTDQSLAEFMGWVKSDGTARDKVRDALDAGELIHEGLLSREDLAGLNTESAQAVVRQARQRREAQEAAARLAEKQAQEAAAEAKRQEERRREYEAIRKQREKEAAEAKEVQARVAAEREANLAAARAQQANEDRQLAERRRAHQEAEAKKRRELGRQHASTVGKAVSRELKSGRVGYRQAAEVAAQYTPMKERPPKDINDYAKATARQISTILRGDRLGEKLAELLKWRDALEEPVQYELAQQLIRAAARLQQTSIQFNAEPNEKLLALPGGQR